MKNANKGRLGFTLIELLVVVLIIGILSAVALPQYQKAVIKSRYATLKELTNSIAQAQELYYLANGDYADAFDKLDLDMPAGQSDSSTDTNYEYDWGRCTLVSKQQVYCYNKKIKMQIQKFFNYTTNLQKGRWTCVASTTDLTDRRNLICKEETRDTTPAPADSYTLWEYQ